MFAPAAVVALLAMAVLLLVAPLHQAVVRHVVCVEHGQAMHQEADLSATPAERATSPDRDHAHAVPLPATPEHGDDHDHCGAPQLTLSGARLSGQASIDDARASAASAVDTGAQYAIRDLYRVAPKTSPPTALIA